MEALKNVEIQIKLDKPDLNEACRVANREGKIRFLDITGYNGFDLIFIDLQLNYDYKLDQTIYTYNFMMDLV